MLSKLLGSYGFARSEDSDPSSQVKLFAPNTEIPFKPALVKDLKRENRTILAALKLLKDKIKQNDIETSREMLVELKRAILDHFIKENVSLFVYIKAITHDDVDKHHLLKELKREMDGVQSMMFLFFSTYLNIELSTDDLYAMEQELSVIGKVMQWRVKREEKELYPLYVAPAAAA